MLIDNSRTKTLNATGRHILIYSWYLVCWYVQYVREQQPFLRNVENQGLRAYCVRETLATIASLSSQAQYSLTLSLTPPICSLSLSRLLYLHKGTTRGRNHLTAVHPAFNYTSFTAARTKSKVLYIHNMYRLLLIGP